MCVLGNFDVDGKWGYCTYVGEFYTKKYEVTLNSGQKTPNYHLYYLSRWNGTLQSHTFL